MVEYLSQFNLIWLGIMASLGAGLATGIGSVPIFLTKKISRKLLDLLLGTAAGIMLAATSFSLIIPAIEKGGGGIKGASITLVGILFGGVFIDFIDKFFPDTNLLLNALNGNGNNVHEVNKPETAAINSRLRKVWLFIIAITVHNLPEGLAVALPLLRENYPRGKAFLVALCTGLVEPIGGLLGIVLVQISRPLLPFALAFAAGSMLFVISHEIIPETQHQKCHSKLATHALLVGFVVMMFLDNTLG